jgi:hypothetical protein
MTDRHTAYRCEDCDQQIPCSVCGVHNCADECGACGGGCTCDCFCPTLRDDAWY